LTPTRPDREDSNSEMSSQNIPLKAHTDFRESSRIPAPETISRLSCGVGQMQLGSSSRT
jgi:hypothetical protein